MFSVSEIARLVDGRLLEDVEETPRRVIHDSRLVQEGDLFVALKGERTDGHAFLEEVFARGACAAIVSDRKVIPAAGRNVICVRETLRALWALAAAWRRGLSAIFVGITGSCGKTTTKALLAHLLAEDFEVFTARKSFNTEIGLPLALLSMSTSAQVGVFELGTSAPGEIAPLANLLSPQITERTVLWQGLLVEYVHRRTHNPFLPKRLYQGPLVHQPASRSIDQHRTRLHHPQFLLPDQMMALFREPGMDRDNIRGL